MDIGLILIGIGFFILAISRFIEFKKPFYLFGNILKGKKAKTLRIISALIMLFLAFGLSFKYIWAFWLFILDLIIGLTDNIMIIFNYPKEIFKTKEFAIRTRIVIIGVLIFVSVYIFLAYF
ncbi:MAG: hypothetical protein KKH88_02550 [Nanoarchaeota archaeon]|nr:hypothetical protein [Nanoarchaeota archaeon]